MRAIRNQKQRKGTTFRQMPSADHSIGRSSLKLSKWTMRRHAKLCFSFGREHLYTYMYSVCRDFVYMWQVSILWIIQALECMFLRISLPHLPVDPGNRNGNPKLVEHVVSYFFDHRWFHWMIFSILNTWNIMKHFCSSSKNNLYTLEDLTWNLQITHLEMIFPTSMIMFHVNLQGCNSLFIWQQPHLDEPPG